MSERKRILQVNIENTGGNGAFALVRYLYSFLKDKFIFDYFTMGKFEDDDVYKSIIADGGKCYSADLRRNKLIGHIKLPFVFYRYLNNNYYDIVHIHSEVAYKHFLYAIAAKLAGVKKVIIHSHSSNIDGDNKGFKFFCHIILRSFVNELGDDFLACSEPTAEWMFSKKTLNGGHFKLLHNGIVPNAYKFSEEKRTAKRMELGISDKVVIGHVGALKKVKNQIRLIEILKNINDARYVLVLIGDGEDKEKLVLKAKELGVENQVIFLGSRTDVADLLQSIDVFVFPSFFEGIPMALIEAEAVGLPIVASDTINQDIKINDNICFVSLDESNDKWIQKIQVAKKLHIKENGFLNIKNSAFNIEGSAYALSSLYTTI